MGGIGEERQGKTQKAIGTHFEEHAGQDDGPPGRSFDVRVRQPGMKGEERNLDGKGERECGEQPHLGADRNLKGIQTQQVKSERTVLSIMQIGEIQDGHQHQETADHGVEQEFERGVNAPFATPDANQEVHGNQHDFPEDVEEKDINRDKGPDHAGFQDEKEKEILPDPMFNAAPGGQNHQRRKKGRQQHEEQADAIDTNIVFDPEFANPGIALNELKRGGLTIKAGEQAERDEEREQRRAKGGSTDQLHRILIESQQEERRQQRNENNEAYHR